MIWIQLAIVLAMILIGARMKGIGLGVMGIVGMLVFVLFFHMRPAEPPLDVMMIILSIVTTAAALQASGGLEYLDSIGERIIRSNPSKIVIIGPLVSYVLCLFSGTSHVIYSLLPVISEVSLKKRIRPERPLSISVIASHMAITGSPMSAATAAFAAILDYPTAAIDIMRITIPACLAGVIAGAFSVWKMGKRTCSRRNLFPGGSNNRHQYSCSYYKTTCKNGCFHFWFSDTGDCFLRVISAPASKV